MTARWLVVLILSVAAITTAVVLHSPMLAVERIDIRGASRTDVAAIVEDLGVGPGAFLVWVDTGEIEGAVASAPWVDAVRVTRVWPDTVEIEVIEHQPVVWIEGVFGWMQVSADGTVVERAATPGPGLMRAEVAFQDVDAGVRPDDPAWAEVVDIASVLSDDIGSTLVLQMRGPEMWTTAFGHDVRLGHPIDLADKGRALRAMLSEDLPGGAIVDVSSPLRPAIVPIEAQLDVEASDSQG